jgi:hypothetical protein
MLSSNLVDLNAAIDAIEALLGDTNAIDREQLSRLLAAAVRLYTMKTGTEGYFNPVPSGSITATDAMIVSSALLHAVNVAVFELGLWQSWNSNGAQQ